MPHHADGHRPMRARHRGLYAAGDAGEIGAGGGGGLSSIAPPAHNRGKHTTDEWITPKWLIDRLGPFDLDPCASDNQPWPCAARQFTIGDLGCLQDWFGLVWMNPP